MRLGRSLLPPHRFLPLPVTGCLRFGVLLTGAALGRCLSFTHIDAHGAKKLGPAPAARRTRALPFASIRICTCTAARGAPAGRAFFPVGIVDADRGPAFASALRMALVHMVARVASASSSGMVTGRALIHMYPGLAALRAKFFASLGWQARPLCAPAALLSRLP